MAENEMLSMENAFRQKRDERDHKAALKIVRVRSELRIAEKLKLKTERTNETK